MLLKTIKRHISHVPILEVFPEGADYNALPLVIYYHGWQTSKELGLTNARKIAKYNIRVVLPDAMFHGDRQLATISTIPSFTFWSSIQHNLSEFDLIVRFYQERNLIKDNQIGVAGFSMGGMTTAGLLTKHPEIKAAAILMGTPNYQAFIQKMHRVLEERKISIPKDLSDLLSWTDNYDLSRQPEKLQGRPLYFWHGTEDEKIDYQQAYEFFSQYRAQLYGEKLIFDTGIGDRHLLKPPTMQKTADFFNNWLNS